MEYKPRSIDEIAAADQELNLGIENFVLNAQQRIILNNMANEEAVKLLELPTTLPPAEFQLLYAKAAHSRNVYSFLLDLSTTNVERIQQENDNAN